MIIKTQVSIPFGDYNTPNKNGRIYTQECVESMVESVKETKKFLLERVPDYYIEVDHNKVKGVVTAAELQDGNLILDLEVFDENTKKLLDYGFSVVPNGSGNVAEDGKVINYTLASFSITNDSAFEGFING